MNDLAVRGASAAVEVTSSPRRLKPPLRWGMAKYTIPPDVGKVRVAMALGHRITVWNGKQGRGEFAIVCRTRKQAEEIAEKINKKQHDGEIVVD